MDIDTLTGVLRAHLLTVLREDDFDLAPGKHDGELDVSTDHWTIHLEGGSGFLALDDEPDDPAEFDQARRAVMSETVERALADADRELGGVLCRALSASGDPFTLALVNALQRS